MPEREDFHSLPLALSYFLFFAILGIFLPYFNLYCYSLNFSARQIGILSASIALAKFVSPLTWTHLADRLGSRNKISRLTSLASALLFSACLFLSDFPSMLAVMLLYGFFRTATVPLMDATVWEMIETRGGEYGKIRVWGSLGFILASLACGWFLDELPLKAALYGIVFLSFLLFIDTLRFPKEFPPPPAEAKAPSSFSLLLKPRLLFFILICMLMQISHGTYYGFFTIHMEELGFSRSLVGLTWGVSVLAEVILMIQYRQWFGKIRPEWVLLLSCFVAAWRWWVMAYSDSLVFLFLAQGSHALTFGAFHITSLMYLNKNVPSSLRTSGQGLVSSAAYGLGGMIGLSLSGWFYDVWGARGLFNVSGLVAFWAGVAAVLHYFTARSPHQLRPAS